jgi:hypothetical protein
MGSGIAMDTWPGQSSQGEITIAGDLTVIGID